MKHDFDKKIKNLLEDASLSDTGFELNKSAVWSNIQSKQKTKIIPFQKWMSHAAALIVGILLCLPFLWRQNKNVAPTVTIIKTISTPAQIIRDTVFIQQPIIAPINTSSHSTANEIQYAHEKVADKALQHNVVPKESIESPIKNNEQPTIAFTEPTVHKNKVMHLLDMDNENAVPRSKKNENYRLFNKITIASNLQDKSETISMIVANQLSNSKK